MTWCGCVDAIPMPKRSSVDDFFAQLDDAQRPHLKVLSVELSLDADPEAWRHGGTEVELAGIRPRREYEPVDASELQEPLLAAD
jgi:hypothetical protein